MWSRPWSHARCCMSAPLGVVGFRNLQEPDGMDAPGRWMRRMQLTAGLEIFGELVELLWQGSGMSAHREKDTPAFRGIKREIVWKQHRDLESLYLSSSERLVE